MNNDYGHISFKSNWVITDENWYILGQCGALIKAISYTPIRPDYREKLHTIALIKGAQATTAIEGNTLSFEEIEEIQRGFDLPPSREYLQKEVENILKGFNTILKEILVEDTIATITPDLIKRFHLMVGDNLGEAFKAQPGKFRRNNVTVGTYRPPGFEKVPELVERLGSWLAKEFHFIKGQSFHETIIQAIITHLYIIWIHPFSDGNGRTARLIEYYLLLRAGVPDIASHILSNFYNRTRNEYYRYIELSTEQKTPTPFLEYALRGFRDGLAEILEVIQENQLLITWRNYIYGVFSTRKGSEAVNNRRRNLILRIPHDRYCTAEEILELHPSVFKHYQEASDRTFLRDLDELMEIGLLEKGKTGYRARIDILGGYMAFSAKDTTA